MRVGSVTTPNPFTIREDSREKLRDIRNKLVDPTTGLVRSGYLRLKPGNELHVGGWFTGGSTTEAKDAILKLISNAYGFRLDTAPLQGAFQEALEQYFEKSGNSFGSKSFVKLIDALESGVYPEDDGQDAVSPGAEHAAEGRLEFSVNPPTSKAQDAAAAAKAAVSPPTSRPHGAPEAAKAAPSSAPLSGSRIRSTRIDPSVEKQIDQSAAKSGISDTAKAQFKALASHLSPNAFKHFSQLMFPPPSSLNPVNAAQSIAGGAPRTFVMGDADGSIGRMVLHAIASGVAQLPENKMPLLADVLESEYRCKNFEDFQSDKALAKAHQGITEALTVKPHGHQEEPSCLFLGDILSDRFTNNQEATGDLIYKLRGYDPDDLSSPPKETGVRFIAGNHDTCPIDKKGGSKNPQWGGRAVEVLDRKEYKELLIRCFDAAVYSSGVLSTHQGVAASDQLDHFQTGLNVGLNGEQLKEYEANQGIKLSDGSIVKDSLRIKATSPEELARKMNELFKSYLQSSDHFGELIATNFRPDDRHMTPKAMGFDGIPGFRQLHGHNADSNEKHAGVTNLNPRDGNKLAPASTVIEYPSQQAEAAQQAPVAKAAPPSSRAHLFNTKKA
jgi:hypothetical protein